MNNDNINQVYQPSNINHSQPNLPLNNYSPYGIQFGDEERLRKIEQQRYKEDLDYLCSLKNKRKQMEHEANQFKQIQYMNDRYNIDKISQQALLREFDQYNAQEAMNKRMEKDQKNKQVYDEYLQKTSDLRKQDEIERQMIRQKKEKIRNDLDQDLQNFYKKRNQEAREKIEEGYRIQNLMKEETHRFSTPYEQHKNKIEKMNQRIYGRAREYNDFVNSPVNGEFFNAKNDFEYNKRIAEQNEREKHARLLDRSLSNQVTEEINRAKEFDTRRKMEKIQNQNNYKQYLDRQNEQRAYRKVEQKSQRSEEQLLMPSYNYPNYPVPLKKKAYDPLHYTPTMINQSFTEERKNRELYLGESKLRHNPITCPIDDIEYNKYVLNNLSRINSTPTMPSSERVPNGSVFANAGNRIIA